MFKCNDPMRNIDCCPCCGFPKECCRCGKICAETITSVVGIIGPAGATGPSGPAGARGATGLPGAIGATGVPGVDGKAATIEVGNVSVSTDGTASVVNTGTSSKAVFDFVIPQARGLTTFGGRYNITAQTIELAANVPSVVGLSLTSSSRGVKYTPDNSITVDEAGSYLIFYTMSPTFSAVATLTFAIRSNGANLIPTQTTVTSTAGFSSILYSGCSIIDLPAGGVLDMSAVSDTAIRMSLSARTIYLNIFKLT